MTTRTDVRSIVAELPALLATLPADAGEVVRVEVDGGFVRVETWRRWPSDGLTHERGTRTVWVDGAYGDLVEVEKWNEERIFCTSKNTILTQPMGVVDYLEPY